ncbi:2-C-methyl-D-erythritol 2,4-cyclodiphosphate synthase [Caldisericum exile]|uniref:2-C-methyl-D-erythritol 2,4-cyclodiphosphate synthase n=1 Tax=Caldisericum exile (strain DSM 21853 / NBRC 104410 / AZM16c01) TaxID=511051 RepID=A0A7U6GFC7_CALEA|nr:2-C-methyl-D-erythritol 2,4-cyclodiphosphate synthase [Caldisericum exile]BAL81369.1 2-C-methyl-D-erythritol 2,4-cyclodiphosphate synthase [Caldisericum exile AZM16c01]
METRIGIGYDSHRFVEGKTLYLGGVEIPFDKGLYGHSDGDALIHAIIDAILGALSWGDIGKWFPDNDPNLKNIRSTVLLSRVKEKLDQNHVSIINIDSVVILEEPRIAPFTDSMREVIAKILGIEKDRISIKGKTNEGMGFVGRKEGVQTLAIVVLEI